MWSLGLRARSKRHGRGNPSSSWLAEQNHITTLSPAAMSLPPNVTGRVAVRRKCMVTALVRSTSSTALSVSDGSARQARHRPG